MREESAEQICRQILEENGGKVADKAQAILFKDSALKEMKEPLQFIKENWRDLTPGFMSLSSEAVGGKREETHDVALAMCLMNLSFTIWDDIIDNAPSKTFKPTIFGKFGQAQAIIIGGVAAAKAFTILNEANICAKKRKEIVKSIWKLWSIMASVETSSLRTRDQGAISSEQKLCKIKSEVIDLGTILKIGATLGNGSSNEIKHLDKYGRYIGIILALRQDFQVSVNLSLELNEKIRNNRLPYSIRWAAEHSSHLRAELECLKQKQSIDPASMKEFIVHFLDTGIFYHISQNIDKYKRLAEAELSYLKISKASQSLKTFVGLQQQLFNEGF